MKTVPLRGAKAAGRVALVDDEDYDLVMQFKWHVWELQRPGRRKQGPYAASRTRRASVRMHSLIMGMSGVDHIDRDGLNNQRSNLRTATGTQNNANTRSHLSARSPYKGVSWNSQNRKWQAEIRKEGRKRHLGFFLAEIEAAYAYDAAAREMFGEYANPNFHDGPTQAMRDQWHADKRAVVSERLRAQGSAVAAWWAERPHETRTCTVCGAEYLSRSTHASLYCGENCKAAAKRRRNKGEIMPATCKECGREFLPKTRKATFFCGAECRRVDSNRGRADRERRARERELAGKPF